MFSAKEMLLSLASNPAAVAVETAVAVAKKAPAKVPSQRLKIDLSIACSTSPYVVDSAGVFRGPTRCN
jgi:hypothetical protein